MQLRTAIVADHPSFIRAIRGWWSQSRTPEQMRELSFLLPRLFLEHFASTSLAAEALPPAAGAINTAEALPPAAGAVNTAEALPPAERASSPRLLGFLVGFHSADHPDEAYVHFVGVDPEARGQGVGRALYAEFLSTAAAAGRTKVRAVTAPTNTNSIAFHRRLGFIVEAEHADHDGPGEDRVCLLRDRSG